MDDKKHVHPDKTQNYWDKNQIDDQKKVKSLDNKLWTIQRSTRSTFGSFLPMHESLRSHYSWYKNYHQFKYANFFNILAAIIATIVIIFFTLYTLGVIGSPFSQAATGIPKMIHYQGKLTDPANIPVPDDAYDMKITIWDAESGGSCLWAWKGSCGTPTNVPVDVTNGIFSVLLGDTAYETTNPLNLSFNDDSYFLQVEVEGEVLTPRRRIGAVGYAYNSDTVDGFHASLTGTADTILPLDSNVDFSLPDDSKVIFRSAGTFIQSQNVNQLLISSDGAGYDDISLSGTVTGDDTWSLIASSADDAYTGLDIDFTSITTDTYPIQYASHINLDFQNNPSDYNEVYGVYLTTNRADYNNGAYGIFTTNQFDYGIYSLSGGYFEMGPLDWHTNTLRVVASQVKTNSYALSISAYNATNNYGIYTNALWGTTNYGIYTLAQTGTTTYGIQAEATNATTNYAVYARAGGSGTTSYGIYATATGATTNWAGYFAGNIGLQANTYINFDTTGGSAGYGIRDNAGSIEVKNSGGSWNGLSNYWSQAGGILSPATTTDSVNIATGEDYMVNAVATFTYDVADYGVYLGQGINTQTNITGDYNIAIGYQPAAALSTGNGNIIMGYQAGDALTAGSYNVILGYQAGTNLTDSNNAVMIGYQAGYTMTSGVPGNNYSTFVGYRAGYTAVGSGNSFFGYQAGYNIGGVSAGNNTAIGYNAGYGTASTNATANVIIGYEAGSVINSSFNTIVGYQAGFSNTIGYHNTYLGYQTGYYNQVAVGQVFMGFQAGNYHRGNYNIAIGYLAGVGSAIPANNTGQYNLAVGTQSGQNNRAGYFNTAVGAFAALAYNSDGYGQTAVGYRALMQSNPAITAGYNTAVGFDSGYFITSGVQNTLLGTLAGANSTTGNYNLALGYNSGAAATYGAINSYIVLGYQAQATASNQALIGSNDANGSITQIYLGNGVTKTSAPAAVTINATGGSGTNIAGGTLNIAGGISTGTALGGDIILKVSPAASGGGTGQNALYQAINIRPYTTSGTSGYVVFNEDSNDMDLRVESDNQTHMLFVDASTDRIGIKNSSPSYTFDLATAVASDRGINIAHTAATGTNYGIYSSVTGASTANYGIYSTATGATTNWAGYFVGNVGVQGHILPSATNTYDLGSDTVRWNALYLNGASLHLGATTDEALLSYATSTNTTTLDAKEIFKIQNSIDSTTGLQILDADGGTPILNVDTSNERVGIGLSNPSVSLEVSGSAVRVTNGTGNAYFIASNTSGATNAAGFFMQNNTSYKWGLYNIPDDSNNFYFHNYTTNYGDNRDLVLTVVSSTSDVTFYHSIAMPQVYSDTVGVTNRDLYIDNNGNLGYVSSSVRYKTDIHDVSDISWLYDLRPVNFTYKSDSTNTNQYGLIAEEVQDINSDFVSYDEDGNPETVSYSKFISPIIKALQDQKKEIDMIKSSLGESTTDPLEQLFATTIISETITSSESKDLVIYPGSGKVKILGDLIVSNNITTDTLTVTKSIATNNLIVMEKTIVKDIEIKGHVLGSHDTRGSITIPAGETKGEFVFDEKYDTKPFVLLTPLQKTDPKYWVEFAKDTDGNYLPFDKFYIKLSEPAVVDLEFNWTAQK